MHTSMENFHQQATQAASNMILLMRSELYMYIFFEVTGKGPLLKPKHAFIPVIATVLFRANLIHTHK